MANDYRDYLKTLQRKGYAVEQLKTGHIRISGPGVLYWASGSPSDSHRGTRNLRKDIERQERVYRGRVQD